MENERLRLFDKADTHIISIGESKVKSNFKYGNFISPLERVLLNPSEAYFNDCLNEKKKPVSLELAGPREMIYFDPKKIKCAVVTCGGLCPGINDVIRSIVLGLYHMYGVSNIYGIKYGFQGFIPRYGHDIVDLTPELVRNIHVLGGSMLASSRGPQKIEEIVDALERLNVSILFVIGGDGTLSAAQLISEEVELRNMKTCIIGIPKTIDNDILMVSRSFGFETAVDVATQAIRSAHTEAIGAYNGIGLVKLMGRESGFVATSAGLAQRDVNFVLIPEMDFDLKGENGFFNVLKRRLDERGHAVIVVAEGAGQKFFSNKGIKRDASGNVKLGDIGIFLQREIKGFFSKNNIPINLKYIDPSYLIRSTPANSSDNVFCGFLGQNAVHAGMAGKTAMLVGIWNNTYVHIPLKLVIGGRKKVDLNDRLWLSVLESTGQPSFKD
ncbi:MAG: ATP-dependent 6-phosphofructokinase [Thermodesulfobacteriota bacterium]|nr:ATP-dependent 6-phosphofructokinase [Thermodesulfobacteriota bacterium]